MYLCDRGIDLAVGVMYLCVRGIDLKQVQISNFKYIGEKVL
jgi:hypothetical protein